VSTHSDSASASVDPTKGIRVVIGHWVIVLVVVVIAVIMFGKRDK
jgi:hypothetical protein